MALEYVVGSGLRQINPQTFEVSGEVDLPILTSISERPVLENGMKIRSAKITCGDATSAEYQVVLKSFGSLGGSEVTHIDTTVTLNSKRVLTLAVSQDTVGTNRSLELSLRSTGSAIATDITVTIK